MAVPLPVRSFHVQFHAESSLQFERQNQKTDISGDTQCREHDNHVPTGPEPFPPQPIITRLIEKLFVALLSAIRADEQDARTVDGKEGPDGVEFRGENLEDDEGKREL